MREAGFPAEADRWNECTDPQMFYKLKKTEAMPAVGIGVIACAVDPEHFNKVICTSCDNRCCPDCAHRHSARFLARYMPVLEQLTANPRRGWKMRRITLTTAISVHSPDVKMQRQSLYKQVRRTFERLLSERKNPVPFKECGMLVSDEFGPKGLKLHFHILYYGPWLTKRVISDIWQAESGFPVVDIRKVGDDDDDDLTLTAAAAECVKYTTKMWRRDRFGEVVYIDPPLIPLIMKILAGTRRVRTWGLFYNAAEEEPKAHCPTCESELIKLAPVEWDIFVNTGFMPTEFTAVMRGEIFSDLDLKPADKSPPEEVPKLDKQELLL